MPDLDRSNDVDNLVVGNYEISAVVSVAPYTKTHQDEFEVEKGDWVYQISVFINCLGPQDESGFDGILRSKFHYSLQRAQEEMQKIGWFTVWEGGEEETKFVPVTISVRDVVQRAVERFNLAYGSKP